MKNNHIKNLSFALTLSLSVLAAEAVFAQQGRGNPNRPTPETIENESARSERQRGKSDDKLGQADDKRGQADEQRAQRGKPDEAGKARNKDKEWKDKDNRENAQNKDKDGHAYGRDKEGLSGREFGQQRAAEARRNNEQRRAALGTTVEDGDKKVKEANEKIARAKEELEKDRKNKKLADAAYNERKARIERAERAVKELEEKVAAGRQMSINVTY